METFYFLFDNPNRDPLWWDSGYLIGFLILLFTTILVVTVFYLFLGKRNSRYSKVGKWFLFMFLNSLLIFLMSLTVINYNVFEEPEGIRPDVWLFSVINATGYAVLFYTAFSLFINNFSIYSKYIPFNLFKK